MRKKMEVVVDEGWKIESSRAMFKPCFICTSRQSLCKVSVNVRYSVSKRHLDTNVTVNIHMQVSNSLNLVITGIRLSFIYGNKWKWILLKHMRQLYRYTVWHWSFITMNTTSVVYSAIALWLHFWSFESISMTGRCAPRLTLFCKFDELRGTQMQCLGKFPQLEILYFFYLWKSELP